MYEEKSSAVSCIKSLWYARVEQVGEYDDSAKESWSLGFTRHANGVYSVELIGPLFGHRVFSGIVSDEYWGVEFYPYITMRGVDKQSATGKLVELPVANGHFSIGEHAYKIPIYEELEAFIAKLEKRGIISNQKQILTYKAKVSLRSNQRKHREIIGLTKKQVYQIKRARKAATLLKNGNQPSDVAAEAGYSDQAHMTRSLKSLLGKTPTQMKHSR